MNGTVNRAFVLEGRVRPLRRLHLVGRERPQREDDMDPLEDEHAFLGFDFAVRDRGQLAAARADPARLQRAPKGAEQSTAGRGDDVIDRGRVRLRHVALDPVVACDRPMCAEPHRLGLGGHVRQPQRSLDTRQRDLGAINDVTHTGRRMLPRS